MWHTKHYPSNKLTIPTARRLVTLSILATLLSMLASAPWVDPATAQATTTMTVLTETAPSDLDPASSYDEISNIVMRGVYESLVALKGTSISDVVPVLADSWDNQNDTVYTFHLHPNVFFHDGTAFDAKAVKTSYTRTITAKLGTDGVLGTFIPKPDEMIQVVDRYTLKITLERPQPLFILALAASYGTAIVSPKVFDEHGSDSELHTWLQTHEAGTGPYTMPLPLDTKNKITLSRFQNYWRGWTGSHFNTIVISAVPESTMRRLALEQGKADAATSMLPTDLDRLQKANIVQTNTSPTLRVDFLIMGEYGPLASPLARRAMCYAFDYAAYNQAALGGRGVQPRGPFPSTLLGYDPTTPTCATDLYKAKELLNQAGVAPGTELTYMTPSGRGEVAGSILQRQLEQLGLRLKVDNSQDYDKFTAILTGDKKANRANFFLQQWWPDYNSPLNYSLPLFYSGSAGNGGENGGYYKNADVDQIIDQATKANSTADMVNLFKNAQKILGYDDPAGIFMAQIPDRTVVSNTVKGHVFNSLYLGTFDFYALSK